MNTGGFHVLGTNHILSLAAFSWKLVLFTQNTSLLKKNIAFYLVDSALFSGG
jgi:hypothetical protein